VINEKLPEIFGLVFIKNLVHNQANNNERMVIALNQNISFVEDNKVILLGVKVNCLCVRNWITFVFLGRCNCGMLNFLEENVFNVKS
jgi:hypothetical protein